MKTANKTGELDNVENDAGIIYDAANDLVIRIYVTDLSSAGNRPEYDCITEQNYL